MITRLRTFLMASSLAGCFLVDAWMQPAYACANASDRADTQAIMTELFKSRLERLDEAEVLPEGFANSLSSTPFFICNDRNFEAAVRSDGSIVFDQALIDAISNQSAALILGQYIHQEFPDVPITALFEALLEYALEQNVKPTEPQQSLGSLVLKVSAGRANIDHYLREPKFRDRFGTLFLHGLGFLILHEQCHVANRHNEQKAAALEEDREALSLSFEHDADRCALSIVNKHEDHLGGSPGAGYIGALSVLSTQLFAEAFFVKRFGSDIYATRTNPAPNARLKQLASIVRSELERRQIRDPRFRDTIDGLLEATERLRLKFDGRANAD